MRQLTKQQTTGAGSPTLRQRAQALRARVIEPAADPIFAVIAEGRRLMPAVRRARRTSDVGSERPLEQDAADDALWLHFHGTLLKTVPTTPAGAVAVAQYVVTFNRFQGGTLEDKDLARALTLIAAVSAA